MVGEPRQTIDTAFDDIPGNTSFWGAMSYSYRALNKKLTNPLVLLHAPRARIAGAKKDCEAKGESHCRRDCGCGRRTSAKHVRKAMYTRVSSRIVFV